MSKEAMQQALKACEVATTFFAKDRQEILRAEAALREAIAEAEKREWVGLTYEEILGVWKKAMVEGNGKHAVHFARAIEATLKQKNHG